MTDHERTPVAKPNRRNRRAFVPGSHNHKSYTAIPGLLVEYGPSTRDDLHHLLGGGWTPVDSPLAHLLEEGHILKSTTTIVDRRGRLVEIEVYHLVDHQDLTPLWARPGDIFGLTPTQMQGTPDLGAEVKAEANAMLVDEPNCPACDQAAPGRGSCGRCAKVVSGDAVDIRRDHGTSK